MPTIRMDIHPDGKRIAVQFRYHPDDVAAVKRIPGKKFISKQDSEIGEPYWTLPLEMDSCHLARAEFGNRLEVGEALKSWAWRKVRQSQSMTSLAVADDAELEVLPEVNPFLFEALRRYQRVAAKFISGGNVCIADQPGLGKTWELIAGIAESGMAYGRHLVMAPKSSLDVVWEKELSELQDAPVWVVPEGRARRERVIKEFMEAEYGWLVINPQMLTFRSAFDSSHCTDHDGSESVKILRKCDLCEERDVQQYPELHVINWDSVTIDESHKGTIKNPKSRTSKAIKTLRSKKRVALTGTPMTRYMEDLFAILQWLQPEEFTSKWRWAEKWCEIVEEKEVEEDPNSRTHKKILGLREDRKQEFFRAITPYILRRTKKDVAPELPEKQWEDVWLDLSGKQKNQYDAMADESAVRFAEGNLTALNVLSEFLRLKQFSVAEHDLVDGRPVPTRNSNKLDYAIQLLDERGIRREEPEGDEKVIIFSQFSQVVDMSVDALNDLGIPTLKLTGGTSRKARKEVVRAFQEDDEPRVLVMTTNAGGTAITLDRADTVIFLDEMWGPDAQEQAEDRAHRISRIHNVTIYVIRNRNTIDEYIMNIVDGKGELHKEILDDRRELIKQALGRAA